MFNSSDVNRAAVARSATFERPKTDARDNLARIIRARRAREFRARKKNIFFHF